MQRIVNFFFGSVRVEVRGSYPERFLNLCARNGIKFRNMETCDVGVFRIDMSPRSFLVIRDIARRSMCRVHIVSKNGLPFLVRRVKKRTLLVAGFALFCIALPFFQTQFCLLLLQCEAPRHSSQKPSDRFRRRSRSHRVNLSLSLLRKVKLCPYGFQRTPRGYSRFQHAEVLLLHLQEHQAYPQLSRERYPFS